MPAPWVFQRIPEAHRRCLTSVLQAASVTPKPIGRPSATQAVGHLMAVVLEIGACATHVLAHLLGEAGPMGETGGLADEQVQRLGVILELGAVRVLPVGSPLRVAAVRILRLRNLADILRGMEEVDELSVRHYVASAHALPPAPAGESASHTNRLGALSWRSRMC